MTPRGLALSALGLVAALDRFWEAADARRLGIDSIQVIADEGPHGERRRIDDIRRCRRPYRGEAVTVLHAMHSIFV